MTGALLSILQWLSPTFPTGSFAYSHGLETAMAGGLRDPAAIADWIAEVIARGSGWNDAVTLALVLRFGDPAVWDYEVFALTGSAERWHETFEQGRAFAATMSAICGQHFPPRCLPVAVGEAARMIDCQHEMIVAAYLHAFASNLMSAATRFVPFGQAEAQMTLARLHPMIAETAARAVKAKPDDMSNSAFRADLHALEHETFNVRIFRT